MTIAAVADTHAALWHLFDDARLSAAAGAVIAEAATARRTIRQNFPSLTLEQVYGAIAFYLAHQEEVETNIREGEEEIDRLIPPLSKSRPELYPRLAAGS